MDGSEFRSEVRLCSRDRVPYIRLLLMTKATFLVALFVWTLPGLGDGDTVTAGRPRVRPGDTILVHAGLYRYRAHLYTGDRNINATTPFEGMYYLTASGTAERPIVIKAAPFKPGVHLGQSGHRNGGGC